METSELKAYLWKIFCADSMARIVRISSLQPRSTLAMRTCKRRNSRKGKNEDLQEKEHL